MHIHKQNKQKSLDSEYEIKRAAFCSLFPFDSFRNKSAYPLVVCFNKIQDGTGMMKGGGGTFSPHFVQPLSNSIYLYQFLFPNFFWNIRKLRY